MRRFFPFALLVALVYLAVATGGFRELHRATMREGDRYAQLAEAFLRGHTYLGEVGDGRTQAWDLSLYQNRYYLYFGAVPALLYYVPLEAVTGSAPPAFPLVALFCFGVFLLEISLLRRFFLGRIPPAAAILLAFGNGSLLELNRPLYYQQAIAGAMFFFLLGVECYLRYFDQRRVRFLVLAGISFALAAGCRPLALAPTAVFLAFAVWPLLRGPRRALVLPYAALAIGLVPLALYNYARFQSPVDFGLRHQQAIFYDVPLELASLRRLLLSLPYRLAALPYAMPRFPFFTASPAMGPHFIAGELYWRERPLGLLLEAPAIFFFLAFLRRRTSPGHALPFSAGEAAAVFLLCALAAFLAAAASPWIVDRYAFDYLPPLAIASVLAWKRWDKYPWLFYAAVAIACYVNGLIALS